MNDKAHSHDDTHHVQVAVLTTSGRWPTDGFDRQPSNQKVRVTLDRAAKELNITNTTGWVAIVLEREIDPERSFADNILSGEVSIDFGPRAGGGGRA